MIKKILKITLKIFLVLAGAYLACIAVLALYMYWSTIFPSRDKWAAAMVDQCNGNFENCIVSAEQVTDFDWDKMYIFGMATSDQLVKDLLGFDYVSDEGESSTRRTIFVKDNQVVHKQRDFYNSFEARPNKSTIISMGKPAIPLALDKDKAVFEITQSTVDDNTYYYLTPIEQ